MKVNIALICTFENAVSCNEIIACGKHIFLDENCKEK